MPNKRSEGGQRNRKLLGEELAAFLADISDLAAELGTAHERTREDRAPEEAASAAEPAPVKADPAAEVTAPPPQEVLDVAGTADVAREMPASVVAHEMPASEVACEMPAPEVASAAEAPALEVIEDLPFVSASYLPPLPPEDEPDMEGDGARSPQPPAAPSPSEDADGSRSAGSPAWDLVPAEGAAVALGAAADDATGRLFEPGVPSAIDDEPLPSPSPLPAPLVPGGLPVLVSRRPWSLAAAMEPLEPLSPPPPRPVLAAQPETVAARRPSFTSSHRPPPRISIPLLPVVMLAMLAVVIVLLVLRLTNL
jgi:hypothetical protein